MSSYNPPTENITQFNSKLFNQPEETLSQAEGNLLYLSKVTSDISNAPSTTFNGQVSFNNFAPISNTEPSGPTSLTTKYYVDFYYLTKTLAASTYQTITGMTNYVSRTGSVAENINGLKTFINNIEIFDVSTPAADPTLILRQAVGTTQYSTIQFTGIDLKLANFRTDGTIIFASKDNARLSISNTITTINNALTCKSQATFETNCPISSVSPSQDNHLTRRDFVLSQNFTTLSAVQSNPNTFSSTTTFSVIPICSVNATATNQLVNWQTLNGQNFTTLSAVQSNPNTFSSTTTFSVIPICSVNATATNQLVNWQTLNGQQFTTLIAVQANANIFSSTTTFSVIPICSVNATATNQLVNWQTLNGQNFTTLTAVQSNPNTFTEANQFNQTLSVTGVLTATGNLKTEKIVPITSNAQQEIYYNTLGASGTIFFGTTGRTMNLYGNANFSNNCQVSDTFKTNNITAINNASVQNIYTSLTASGTINLGSATANTTTNITGGTLNLGSTNFDTRINSTTTNFASNGALTIGTSVAPASFSFFSTLLNTTINFFSGLTSGTINFCSSTTMNTMFNLNARVKLRTYKLVDELQTLTLTSHTLVFPLQQTTIFTNTANVSVTLPEITNDAQLGLRFTFVNLGSITTTTTFVRQGSNLIIPVGQMGQFTSSAIINNTKTICNLVIVKLGGIYIWTEYTF